MATTTDTSRVIIDTSQATPALARLQGALDKTAKTFGGLRSTLLGLGFAALARGAVLAADEIKDLSDSTGIAVARLKEFQAAMDQSGGNGNDLTKSVTTFSKSIEEAVQGSLSAQNSFAKLGVTLDDLRTMSEFDLMQKTLDGINKFIPKGQQAVEMMDKFGKSARTMSAGAMSEELRRTAGEGDRVAGSIERAAKLNDEFAKAADNVRMAFLKAFEPIIKKVNEFSEAVDKNEKTFDGLVTGIKLVGVAISTSFVAGTLTGFVTMLGSVGRGLGTIIGLLGASATGTFVTKLFAATGAAARLLPALRAIALLVSTGFGIYAATQLFEDFGDIASNALARVIEGLGELTAEILNLPTDAIAGVMNLFGAEIKDPWGLGTPIQGLVDKAKAAREEFEKTAKAAKVKYSTPGTADAPLGDSSFATPEERVIDTTVFDNAKKSIQEMTKSYSDANDRIREQIDLDNSLIGATKSYADSIRGQAELARRTTEEIDRLTEAKNKMSKDEREAGLGKVYDEQIAKVIELAEAEQSRLAESIELTEQLTKAENLRQFGISQQVEISRQLRSIQDETAKLTLTEIEKKYYDIAAAARESAEAAIAAEEARRNEKLSPEEIAAYYKTAQEGVLKLTEATKKQWEESRKFSTGWKQAWQEYADNANNAALEAKRVFDSISGAFESAIEQMVRTGKVGWKDLLTDMTVQFMKADIQKLFASITAPAGQGGSSGSGLFQSIGKFFAGGFANGGFIPAGGYGITGENGPEYVSGPAQITPMQNTSDTYHVTINAVDSKSVQQLLSQHPELIYGLSLKGQRALGA